LVWLNLCATSWYFHSSATSFNISATTIEQCKLLLNFDATSGELAYRKRKK
jgi:hypothetical protein